MKNNDSLAPELAQEITTRVFEKAGFIRLTQVLRRGGKAFRISLRPVVLRGETRYQAEMMDAGRTEVRNLSLIKAHEGLEEILAQTGPRELHLITTEGDLHLRVTQKGKVLVSRGAPQANVAVPTGAHDRVKKQPLTSFDATTLLQVIDIADANGAIKPSMRGKYNQVNELLRELDTLLPKELTACSIVDCGCGRAYLTLAAYAYLSQTRQIPVTVVGIDRNAEIIETATQLAQRLDCAADVTFQACTIEEATFPDKPTLVMSLHACDTATDDALIAAVQHQAQYILCVPCCQHELHHALKKGDAMRAVLRHGILRERLADILTDTFRAQVLRIMGYRARVIEFVSADATARNILIRAEQGLRPGLSEAVSEYEALKEFWDVDPYIGKLLPVSPEK